MRYSVFTLAYPGKSIEELIDLSASLGYDGIDLRIADDEHLALDAPRPRRAELLKRVRDCGIRFSALYSYLGKPLVDPESSIRAAEIDRIRALVDLANDLEAPLARIWAGTSARSEEHLDRFIAAVRPAAEYAHQAGVRIVMPNHNDLAYDAPSCRRIVEGLGRDRVGIIYDPPNIERTGLDPIAEGRDMWDCVDRVEFKDWRLRGRVVVGAEQWAPVEATPLGLGEASLTPVVELLKEKQYDGWISNLYEKRWHPELPEPEVGLAADLAYLRRAFAE
jgi:sugar phosphate isomerase/epimerase